MRLLPLPPEHQALILRAIATFGLVTALLVALAGWLLLGHAEQALGDSLRLTADTLEALDASAGVAADTVEVLGTSLEALEATSVDLDSAFADGEVLLGELAELLRRDVADTLGAVEGALPGLVTVAGTIDLTLGALGSLPFAPPYNPDEPFAESLGEIATALDGAPDRLRDQADLVDQTATSLAAVGDGVADLAAQVAGFRTALAGTSALLATYDETIEEGIALVTDAQDGLGARLAFGRVAVVAFAVAFAALQVVPLHLAALADMPGRGRHEEAVEKAL